MSRRETELDRITSLLGRCLGRIDEQAYRLQHGIHDEDEVSDVLEREAALLQELISTIAELPGRAEHADLNRTVEQAVRGCVAELETPIVVRQRLAAELPRIACTPGQLAYAVQRAVMLAIGSAEAGDVLIVATSAQGDGVLCEFEAQLAAGVAHAADRAATLTEFVAGFGGSCRIQSDTRGSLLIAFELPVALVAE
ncbi:MAG: hypothetical protein U1E73_02475 [Planctomycetota bacterium]